MKKVTDDMLGVVATKQWELFRRVKEGSLNPHTVINALQGIIENQVEQFSIEKLGWTVSSRVYDIFVEERSDFVEAIKSDGYGWNYHNPESHKFKLKGSPKKRKYKAGIRLAKIPDDCEEAVLRTYADIAGFDFATSWEMLAFIKQNPLARVLHPNTHFIALGDYGEMTFDDTSPPHYAHVTVTAWVERRKWSFDDLMGPKRISEFPRQRVSSIYYILLKEKN